MPTGQYRESRLTAKVRMRNLKKPLYADSLQGPTVADELYGAPLANVCEIFRAEDVMGPVGQEVTFLPGFLSKCDLTKILTGEDGPTLAEHPILGWRVLDFDNAHLGCTDQDFLDCLDIDSTDPDQNLVIMVVGTHDLLELGVIDPFFTAQDGDKACQQVYQTLLTRNAMASDGSETASVSDTGPILGTYSVWEFEWNQTDDLLRLLVNGVVEGSDSADLGTEFGLTRFLLGCKATGNNIANDLDGKIAEVVVLRDCDPSDQEAWRSALGDKYSIVVV